MEWSYRVTSIFWLSQISTWGVSCGRYWMIMIEFWHHIWYNWCNIYIYNMFLQKSRITALNWSWCHLRRRDPDISSGLKPSKLGFSISGVTPKSVGLFGATLRDFQTDLPRPKKTLQWILQKLTRYFMDFHGWSLQVPDFNGGIFSLQLLWFSDFWRALAPPAFTTVVVVIIIIIMILSTLMPPIQFEGWWSPIMQQIWVHLYVVRPRWPNLHFGYHRMVKPQSHFLELGLRSAPRWPPRHKWNGWTRKSCAAPQGCEKSHGSDMIRVLSIQQIRNRALLPWIYMNL